MSVKKILVDFYSRYKDFAFVHFLKNVYSREYSFPYDYFAEKRLERIKRKEVDLERRIRICFIVTDPNVWNKLEPVYNEMKSNDRFDVFMLCVPDIFDDNGSYEYFEGKGYDCINAIEKNSAGKKSLFNLKSLAPDYVFYGQPYNNYLPRPYRSYSVAKYARVCIMTYGMTVSWNFLRIHPRNFHRDVYKCYAVVKEEIEFNKGRFPRLYQRGLQQTLYLGFPAFSIMYSYKDAKSKSFLFSKNDFRAIWTPRWITDEKVGGSNFFRYKDVLFDFASKNRDIDILFRPHPMALENFVNTGEMTRKEVEEFKRKCFEEPNLSLDENKEYSATFWNSDLLISDLSTIVVEYFVTGKPIIYCSTPNSEQEYLEYFEKILSVCYIVKDEVELCERICMIKKGDDPMREKRLELIPELFGNRFWESSKLIVNDFIDDYYGGC